MEQLIEDSLDVVQAIEEALAANDPYNCDTPDDIVRLSDCDLPDHIEDPFALLRHLFGNERVREWEYADDLEFLADALRACVKRVQQEGNAQGGQSDHRQKVQGQEDGVCAAAGAGAQGGP
jgi:hypothetical protein